MSDSDALMWNIEKDPLLRSTIVTVLLLDQAPDWDRLVDTHRARHVADPADAPARRDAAAAHGPAAVVGRRELRPPLPPAPGAGVRADDRRGARPRPRRRRWPASTGPVRSGSTRVVEGLEGGKSAMILKVHHSMTDGVGGMKLLLMLFDFERRPGAGGPARPRRRGARCSRPMDLVLERARAQPAPRRSGIARRSVLESVARRQRACSTTRSATAQEALRAAGSIVRFLDAGDRSRTPRSCAPGRWPGSSARIDVPLDELKRAAKTVGGSLNDSFVAGGARRDAALPRVPRRERRRAADGDADQPPRATAAALGGNHFTPARFLVPLTIKDPSERIVAVGRLTKEIRAEPAVQLTDALAGVLNQLPTTITTALFGSMLKGADFVTSNVPGAPFPIYSAGAALERMYAFAPLAGAADQRDAAVELRDLLHRRQRRLGRRPRLRHLPPLPRRRLRRDPRPRLTRRSRSRHAQPHIVAVQRAEKFGRGGGGSDRRPARRAGRPRSR